VVTCLQPNEFQVVAHLRHRNPAGLEQAFWEIADPDSPRYLQHLKSDQVVDFIGASDSDIADARQWLLSIGAIPSSLSVSNLRDTVTATFYIQSNGLDFSSDLSAESSSKFFAGKPPAVSFTVRRHPRQIDSSAGVEFPRNVLLDHPDASYNVKDIKGAYGIPADMQASNATVLQMVWGPGTFGFSNVQLRLHKLTQCPLLNLAKVKFDTDNHGKEGGDNFAEGNLDTKMITSFGLNVETLVSNTNTSASTEEGSGFGEAFLDFLTELKDRPKLPHVLSISLGSLSAVSCNVLCSEVAKMGHSEGECRQFLQQQRQVCMFLNTEQVDRINTALQVLGARGVTVFAASGDGGSHFSFTKFSGGAIADALNTVSCNHALPTYPSSSPYIVSIGGSMWKGDSSHPVTWGNPSYGVGSGGGFSRRFAAPKYQESAVKKYLSTASNLPSATSFNASNRAYPDISAVGIMGTSQATPIMAGIFSMITDYRLNAGLPPLGFAAPRIWKVAQEHPGEAFMDITEGNSKTSCDEGFPSAPGWDPNTGWGRPVWKGMLKYLGSDDRILKQIIV